jgi:hypothetical protein
VVLNAVLHKNVLFVEIRLTKRASDWSYLYKMMRLPGTSKSQLVTRLHWLVRLGREGGKGARGLEIGANQKNSLFLTHKQRYWACKVFSAFARLMLGSYGPYICAFYNSQLVICHVQFKGLCHELNFFEGL